MAHEYTHTVIAFLCDLGDGDETAAINEGCADVFGELVEAWATGSCDWIHGSRTIYDPSANRYAEAVSDKGNGGEDYAHGHSTVISHAAYLMHTGDGQSVLEPLSDHNLARLFYTTLRTLPSNCDFSQFRAHMENAADIMYKQSALTQRQRACVTYALMRVGIPTVENTCYVVSDDLSFSIYDINEAKYSNFVVTAIPVRSAMSNSGLTGTSFEADEHIKLNFAELYWLIITDKGGSGESIGFLVMPMASGHSELTFYTTFGELSNTAFQEYLDAAERTTASGSWTEQLSMRVDIEASSGENMLVSVDAATDIDGYEKDDQSELRISSAVDIYTYEHKYAWDMTYANGVAYYSYLDPEAYTEDIETEPIYFNFASITQDMVSVASSFGNIIKFYLSHKQRPPEIWRPFVYSK